MLTRLSHTAVLDIVGSHTTIVGGTALELGSWSSKGEAGAKRNGQSAGELHDAWGEMDGRCR